MKINEVSAMLGLSASALKKYYLLFEKNNYKFTRSKQGQLVFSEYEVELFRKLIHLKNEPGNTVEKSVEILLNKEPQKNKELDLMQLLIQQGIQLNIILDSIKEIDNKIKKLNKKVDKL
ncbi:MerR family transcriptional regulator [Bacillus sp. V2I10]|uniref:MerR family transcriptional regulator n=1 Tax=Bacillus sp. V2I10 TaxID=3042276 RepID=UPI00277FE5CA|nr:MerR family transcriptional regulator [Bacillus sp. V2I10]MDQ0861614.1 DNA-binding transcriptional MerR regulator [Bacillus sp. V2I10]